MAKAKDDKAPQPIDEDSVGLLSQAKKGKSFRFVMVFKGANVLSLMVFKKGKPQSRIPAAKQLAKDASGSSGEACHGVVSGDGATLVFHLLASDGHKEGPVKSNVVKSFLSDYVDCRPMFQVGDKLPLVLADDNPLVARLLALNPAIVRRCDEQPDQAAALGQMVEQIGKLLDDEQDQDAAQRLDDLEKLLGSSSPSTGTADADAGSPQAEFQRMLQEMKPLLDLGMAESEGVRNKIAAIGQVAKAGQYVAAIEQLTALRQSLAEVATYRDTMAKVNPTYLATMQKQPANAGRLRALMGQIQAAVEAGTFAAAVAGIRNLLVELKNSQGKETDVVAPGTVAQTVEQLKEAFRKSSLVWTQTRKTVEAELGKLEQAVLAQSKDEPDFATIQANSKNLFAILDALDDRLSDRLDEAATAEDDETRAERQQEAIELVDEYLDFCATNDFLQNVDNNGFVTLKIKSLLDTSLLALKRRLQQQLLGA